MSIDFIREVISKAVETTQMKQNVIYNFKNILLHFLFILFVKFLSLIKVTVRLFIGIYLASFQIAVFQIAPYEAILFL